MDTLMLAEERFDDMVTIDALLCTPCADSVLDDDDWFEEVGHAGDDWPATAREACAIEGARLRAAPRRAARGAR
jgi:hypothetical protein